MTVWMVRPLAVATALICVVNLSGCREDERRLREYEPGVYKGKKDQEIDDKTRETLRERTKKQEFGL